MKKAAKATKKVKAVDAVAAVATVAPVETVAAGAAIAGSSSIGKHPNAIVMAGPGTGKTFTMLTAVAYAWGDRTLPTTGQPLWKAAIGRLGFEPKPSKEQAEVWEFVARSRDARTVQYLAFNKSIVKEFEAKYAWLQDLLLQLGVTFQFSTAHAMGMAACRKAYSEGKWRWVNGYKSKELFAIAIGRRRGRDSIDLVEYYKEPGSVDMIRATCELVRLSKLTLTGWGENGLDTASISDDALEQLATNYDVLLPWDTATCFSLVREILQQARDSSVCRQMIDYEDMLWLPIVNNLPVGNNGGKIDLLIVDEAQDLCRCAQELCTRAGKQIVLVGDPRQAIYGFAGADTESLSNMHKRLSTTGEVLTFELTETRRCGKAIVSHAVLRANGVPHSHGPAKLTANDNNPPGILRQQGWEAAFGEYKQGDLVLCRTNAPLVRLAFAMLKERRPVQIQGRPIGEGLRSLVYRSKAKDVGSFLVWLDQYQEQEANKLLKQRQANEEAVIALADKCDVLRALADGAFTIKDLYENIKKLDKMFQPEEDDNGGGKSLSGGKPYSCKDACTLLSSIHRAKGMEAKRVYILRPDLLPHPKASSTWAREQESNLVWVATTRAIEELCYVLPLASGAV